MNKPRACGCRGPSDHYHFTDEQIDGLLNYLDQEEYNIQDGEDNKGWFKPFLHFLKYERGEGWHCQYDRCEECGDNRECGGT